jgi:hypothetical protein
MLPSFLAIVATLGLIGLGIGVFDRSPARSLPLPRYWWLLGFAVVPQFAWAHWIARWPSGADALTWVIPLSYVPVVGFLLANAGRAWARLVLVGAALNLLVIVLNGGAMPARAVNVPSGAASASVAPTHLVPETKDRALGATTAWLEPLADRYVVPLPGGAMRLMSAGDAVVLGGALLALLTALGELAGAGGRRRVGTIQSG